MLRVSSAEACTDPGAYHQMWVHHLDFSAGKGNLTFDVFPMDVGPDDLRDYLKEQGETGIPAAEVAVGALREFTLTGQLPELKPGELVTASLIRICRLSQHRDLKQTAAGERAEVISRHIWGQPGVEPFSQYVRNQKVALNDEFGIGWARVDGQDGERLRRPVAGVPLTASEVFAARSIWGNRKIVAAGAPRSPLQSVFALAHMLPGGRWIERIHQPPLEPEPVLQVAPEQDYPPLRLVHGGRA